MVSKSMRNEEELFYELMIIFVKTKQKKPNKKSTQNRKEERRSFG